jgi:hypothetical protein
MRCLLHKLDAPVCDGIQPKHQDVERGEGGEPVRFASLRGLVQVAATASSVTRDFLPSPEASSPRQLASVAWPDVTSSPRSDSSLLEALHPQIKRTETQFIEAASDLQASQREGVEGARVWEG